MTPPNSTSSPIQCRVAFVPYESVNFRPEPPTAASWRFLRENANVTGVRLQFRDRRLWSDAYRAVVDGGPAVHGNFCIDDPGSPDAPREIEELAFEWVRDYPMASVSAYNEPGYAFGPDDIGKGGTRDYMKELVDNFWLPFIRGVRRANPDITIGGPDAESADTLQRFVNLVDVDQWLVHPYGEPEVSEGDGLHFARMVGHDGEPGFNDVFNDRTRPKTLLISEIDHQQLPAAKARGEFRGIATDEEIDRLTAFCIRMRDEFKAPVVTLGTGEYFCTRVPVTPWIKPPQTWSTWTHGTPAMSDAGKRLAAVFAPVKPAPLPGRRRAMK